MRHVVLTRSAYGPAWDREANERRLAVTRAVTVASMRAQTGRDWAWIVALHKDDPLREERRAVFAEAGVPVKFINISDPTTDKAKAAVAAYRANWGRAIGKRDEWVAMTRLDDDDALAPWAIDRIAHAACKAGDRMALILPYGMRLWEGKVEIVRHESNAMQTLVTPPGDTLHVYEYLHRKVRGVAHVRQIERGRIAWLWVRHPDTISGWKAARFKLNDRWRSLFPIDWSLLEAHGNGSRSSGPIGRYFR